MNLLYLLAGTDLSGGVRVVLAQADALVARGHRVSIATGGEPVHWRHSHAHWLYLRDFSELESAEAFDFVIGTFWTTVPVAYSLAGPRAVHLCQGYEGSFEAYLDRKSEIDAVYALPVPKMVVTRYLEPVVRQFGSDVAWVGQIVDEPFYRERTPEESDPPRVLLAGAAQVDIKGIDDGYGAVSHARWHSHRFDLVRVSPWRPSPAEPADQLAQEFHVALTTNEMTSLVHSCDVFLGPNRKEEGFGLVAAEAMAAGIPCVLTKIPSYLSFDPVHNYALFAGENDPEDLGERLMELLGDEDLRVRLQKRGRQVAAQFHASFVAERIEQFLLGR
jgi:glycosyltransferase involved in cell wall biosynthesis